MKIKKVLMMGVAGMAFFTLANAQAATIRTYDENGMLVQEGSYTFSYEYYDDGRVRKKTKLSSSGSTVEYSIYTYDDANKTITSRYSGNGRDFTYYYDNADFYNNASKAENVIRFSTGMNANGNVPLGAYKMKMSGASDTIVYQNDAKGNTIGLFFCYTTSCVNKAAQGDYSETTSDKRYYTYNDDGSIVERRNSGTNTWTYEYDAYGNVTSVKVNGRLEYTYNWEDPAWNYVPEEHVAKRIYTVEEATEAAKGNKNTFTLKYR